MVVTVEMVMVVMEMEMIIRVAMIYEMMSSKLLQKHLYSMMMLIEKGIQCFGNNGQKDLYVY